jgi:hypothetical protein
MRRIGAWKCGCREPNGALSVSPKAGFARFVSIVPAYDLRCTERHNPTAPEATSALAPVGRTVQTV